MKYADPSRCPGCREELAPGAVRCTHCDLLVRHPLAQQVFASLTRADELIARLRVEAPLPAAPGVETHREVSTSSTNGGVEVSTSSTDEPVGTPARLRFSSVPKVLLGLGALCLLVAAVIFLAVSWSWLGVGGRTAVLLGLTAGAAAVAAVLLRHELRIAAEALSAVCLGLVALDVAGADSAGWLGELSDAGLATGLGLVVALTGTGFAFLTRPHLGAPQVAAALGALVAYAGALALTSHDLVAGHVSVVLLAAALVAVRRGGLRIEAWSLVVVAALVWCVTALLAVGLLEFEPTLRGVWLEDGAGWSLLASAAVLLAPGAVLRREGLLVWGGAGAALVATVALTAPAVDESARVLALVALLTTAAWVAATAALPAAARRVAAVPATAGSILLGGLVIVTAAVAATRWAGIGWPFSADAGVRFGGPDPVTEPLVAAPAVAVVVALLAASRTERRNALPWLGFGGLATGVAALVTLASYDVPLAVVSGGAGVLSLVALALALRAEDEPVRGGQGVLAVLLAALGCALAAPSAALTAVAAVVTTVVAVTLHLASRSATARKLGGAVLAPATALVLWSSGTAWEVDAAWLGVPVMVAVGVLAIARPRPEVEVPAAVVAVVALGAAVPAAADMGSSLALHLTVAGGLVATTALVNDTRRHLGRVGLALLVLASWVRLGDLGVTAPEPYTLPLALVLTGAGLWQLRRDPRASTMVALLPGLGLATLPSLLWVLGDPVSVRALLLGAACVALAIGGAALRWSAPLVVGAAVGAVVVLRELGPYAAVWPQWVWIGLAGTLLTVVGVTWERRLHDLRLAAGLVGRLR